MGRKTNPIIRLPRSSVPRHPFLIALDRWAREGKTKTQLAKEIGVTPQSLNSWRVECLDNRDFLLPAATAAKIAKVTGLSPRLFRPDIWSLYGHRESGATGKER